MRELSWAFSPRSASSSRLSATLGILTAVVRRPSRLPSFHRRDQTWFVASSSPLSGSIAVLVAGPVSADSSTPSNCWGLFSNDGQTAASALSSIGADGQPGLSAFNQGGVAAFVAYEQATACPR